jgi:hypothetical protein
MRGLFILAPRINFSIVAQSERDISCCLDLNRLNFRTVLGRKDYHRFVNVLVFLQIFLMAGPKAILNADLTKSVVTPCVNLTVLRKSQHVVLTNLNARKSHLARNRELKGHLTSAPTAWLPQSKSSKY